MPLYDEIEIEDMTYHPETKMYSYPCPCGDRFKVTLEDLWDGEDIAGCESCTLYIEVIYDEEDLHPYPGDDDDDDDEDNQSVDKPIIKQDGTTEKCDKEDDDATTVNKALEKLSVSSQ